MAKIYEFPQLLQVADGMLENRRQVNLVSNFSDSNGILINKMDDLIEAVSKRHTNEMSTNFKKDKKQENANYVCFYHKKFGQNALRCTHPCKFHDDFLRNVNKLH